MWQYKGDASRDHTHSNLYSQSPASFTPFAEPRAIMVPLWLLTERNLFLIFHLRLSVQIRLLFHFLYLYYRALSFLHIRSSLSIFKIFTTFNVPRVKWKDFLILQYGAVIEAPAFWRSRDNLFKTLQLMNDKVVRWTGERGGESMYLPRKNKTGPPWVFWNKVC